MWGYVLIAFITVQRLSELWLSHQNALYLVRHGAVRVTKDGMTGLATLHSTFLLAALAEYTLTGAYVQPLWITPLIALIAAQALRYWSIGTLGRRWNIHVYVLPGAEPTCRGPYRFLRHPNYLAVAIEMICLPLCLHAYITAFVFTLLNTILVAQRIAVEEEALRALTPYDKSMHAVFRGVLSLPLRKRP
ncbi:MAG: hypothetical protein OWT28_12675 [Firmicutes bacterium]|nr:hypothetical protein [Bacillota bacterium]